MRHLGLWALFLIPACVTFSEQQEAWRPPGNAPPPPLSPGGLAIEANSPTAPVIEQERCPPGEDAVGGRPGRAQAEAGVLSTVPDALGVPRDTRFYMRSGCEPAH